jgi:hypothetical protein
MADPLKDIFGPSADPLADVFGTAPNRDFETGIQPQAPGALESALEGKSASETAAETTSAKAIKGAADQAAPAPSDSLLDELSDKSRSMASGIVSSVGMGLRGLGREGERIQSVAQSVFGDGAQDFLGKWFAPSGVGTMLLPGGSVLLNPSASKGLTGAGQAVQGVSDTINVSPEKQQQVGNIIANALGQVTGLIAMSAVGGEAAVEPAILGQSFDQIDQALGEKKVKDNSPAALAAMSVGGPAMAVLEKTGLDAILEGVPLPIKNRVLRGIADVGIVGGWEGAEEVAQQIVQNFAVKLGVDPNTPVRDWGKGLMEGVLPNLEGGAGAGAIARLIMGGFGAHYRPRPTSGQLFGDVPGNASDEAINAFRPGQDPLGDVFGGEQPGTDTLGRAPTPQPPKPGRSYNVADAIAELGMSPEEAQAFVSTGKDPRPTAPVLEEHGFTPGLTEADAASPIDDTVIAAGKDILGTALEKHSPLKPAGKASIPMDVVQGLINEGIPEHIARGAAAGVAAEANGGSETALNSTSGAFGLGQWVGSRKQGLFERYGPNPTRAQQIQYLAYELKGGDQGGKSVLAAKDETDALHRYITDFMRPAAGKETDSDLQRGMAALGRAGQAIGNLQQEAAALGGEDTPREAAATVEGTLKQAGVDLNALGEDVTEFKPGQRIDVTQNESTVPGTVQEVYGEGPKQGVRVALDNGTTFDEEVARAREYGARLTHPKSDSQIATDVPNVEVPQEAQPLAATFGAHVGEQIDNEFSAFHPDTGTLGIPRAEMPQIKQEHRGAAVNFFEARGISAEPDEVPASSLKPTQAEFAPAKVQKFLDNDAGERSVLVSSDGYVLDGHHQWVAALERGSDVKVIRLGAPIKELLTAAHAFPSSQRSEGSSQVQPDMFGGEAVTAEQMDARRLAPRVLREVTKANKLDDLWDATDYVLRRSEKTSAGAGDIGQSVREFNKVTGRNLNRKEATAYALELERLRDAGESGKPKAKSEQQAKALSDTALDYDTTERHERAAWLKAAGVTQKMLPGDRAKVTGTPFNELPKEVQTRLHEHQNGKPQSTAPEHATVGVDDRELHEIVSEFNDAQESMIEGGDELITHIFDKPKPDEIVRLNQKSRVYHKEHGWMTPKEAAAKIREWEDAAVKQGQDPKARSRNSNRVVLSFFDLSGEWSLPWEQAGYQVYRFDIQAPFADLEGDGVNPGDVNNFSPDFFADWFGDFDGLDIYAILSANPCTDFASSGARHFAAKDRDGRTVASVKLVHQTLAAIEYFKPSVWALENPVGRIEKLGGLPPWRLSFDPNDLGDPYTKKTLLWGRFNADLPIAPVEPTEGSKIHTKYGGKSLKTKNARSVTPEGFSYGFFMANNAEDHPVLEIAGKYDRLDRSTIEAAVARGVTKQQIDEAVEDFYYQDLDDEAANKAIAALQPPPKEPIADQPTEAPASVATAEALREKAQPHQDELVAWGENWDRQSDEYGFINPGLKSAARIVEKLTSEGYESLDEIKDVARVGFKITDRNRATDLVVSAKRKFGAENVTDKGWRMVDGDYFDRKLVITFSDGTKAEVQIIPDAIEKFRHEGGADKLYAKWRSTEPGAEKDALLKQMEDGYAKAAAGTSWESLFNELKSARGKALAAAASESETPGLVANPGAGRQTSADDQTTAQGLPETAPEATSRSSISNSEKSAIGSNVGNASEVGNVSPPNPFGGPVPSREQQLEEGYDLSGQKAYGAANKIVTRDQAEIARAIIRNKLKNQLNSGFDPDMLSAGAQLAAFHLEAGARKFADFAKAVADDLGTQAVKLKPYLAAWYNGARDLLEGHGVDVSDMDTPETVRAGITSLSTGVDVSGDNGGTNGGIATDQGIEGPDRASDAGESPGDVPGAVGVGEPGQGSVGEGSAGAGQLRAGAESGVEPRASGEPQSVASGSDQRDHAGAERGGARSARSSRRVRDTARRNRFPSSPRQPEAQRFLASDRQPQPRHHRTGEQARR